MWEKESNKNTSFQNKIDRESKCLQSPSVVDWGGIQKILSKKYSAMHFSFSGAFEIAIETRFEFLFCHYLLPSHLSYLNRKRTSHNHQKCKSKNKFPHQTNTYNNNDSRCCLNKFPPPLFQTTLPSPRVPRFPTPKAQANDT